MKEILPMWPTLVTLWLALSGNAPPRPAPRRRPSYRPRLEALEDRAVPASLSYSTFLNGTVFATAVDSAGDVYITGSSSNLQTTPGAFETSGTGAFVAKLNPTGTAVLYAMRQRIGQCISLPSSGRPARWSLLCSQGLWK